MERKEDKADQEQDMWNQPASYMMLWWERAKEWVGGEEKRKLQHKNALCTWAKMYKYIRKIFKNNMNKYMNSSWKTFLCCYGESGKRVTQIYKYHTQTKPDNKCIYQKTRLQYKTEIHNYIKIVNLKFIFNVSFYYFNLLISMDVWSIVRSTPHHMRCFISHGL